jgi:hypothetical protein
MLASPWNDLKEENSLTKLIITKLFKKQKYTHRSMEITSNTVVHRNTGRVCEIVHI